MIQLYISSLYMFLCIEAHSLYTIFCLKFKYHTVKFNVVTRKLINRFRYSKAEMTLILSV
jgi:hypothetical protein